MFFLTFWLGSALLAMYVARNRTLWLWVPLSLLFGPFALFAALVLYFVQAGRGLADKGLDLAKEELDARRAARAGPNEGTHKKCPDCAEWVARDARACKHCGKALLAGPSAQSAAS